MQPHIHLDEGTGIRCAILPGDPARVERIAAYLDDVRDHGSHREYRSISGTWRGVPVLAMSTGMGGPSAAIAVEELRRIGVESLIRIGSCGALQTGIAVGDLILVQAAVREEGTSQAYVPAAYPAVSDAALLASDMETAALLTVARLRGLRAMSILNTVVPWGGDTLDGIGAYSGGAEAAQWGEAASIQTALDACAAIEREGRTGWHDPDQKR